MSKPVLYTFSASVWGAVAELAVAELTQPGEIEMKTVDLLKGENFDPEFIKTPTQPSQHSKQTVKSTRAPSKSYNTSSNATGPGPGGKDKDVKPKELLEKIHEERLDPNFAFVAFARCAPKKRGRRKRKESPGRSYLADNKPSNATPNPPPAPPSKTSTPPVSPPTAPSSPHHPHPRVLLEIQFTL
ncbi:hypothetical protein PQX77_017742 [Marasmius sp. AFHP31]|nr:hypothetical protein PQX77_017742 [Marasmius sp. AFHP31]